MELTPDVLLTAYSQGLFPMADSQDQIHWYSANPRGIIPLDRFHIPSTLRQLIRQNRYQVCINRDFQATMRACSQSRPDGTWINEQLIQAYVRLHELSHAHSVEVWENDTLVGGLYGVSLGGAFFGESMFHRKRDTSKIALAHLVNRLNDRGYALLDTQANTRHLTRFGCIEIPAEIYYRRLQAALPLDCTFA